MVCFKPNSKLLENKYALSCIITFTKLINSPPCHHRRPHHTVSSKLKDFITIFFLLSHHLPRNLLHKLLEFCSLSNEGSLVLNFKKQDTICTFLLIKILSKKRPYSFQFILKKFKHNLQDYYSKLPYTLYLLSLGINILCVSFLLT